MKQKVIGIRKYGDIIHLTFNKTDDFHIFLCDLTFKLNFDESEILNADMSFSLMFDDYLLLRKDETKFHLFVTENTIHLIIDSKSSENILQKIKDQTDFLTL